MSSPPASNPDDKFNARVGRVADARAPYEATKPYVSPIPDWKDNVRGPVAVASALVVGMLAVFVARYIRFQYLGTGLSGEGAGISMIIDATLAGAISFLVFGILRQESAAVKGAQVIGILAMVGFMHNLVHLAPDVFNAAYSKEWTDEVVAATEPNSFLFVGGSIVLYEPKKKPAKKPTVRRAGKT